MPDGLTPAMRDMLLVIQELVALDGCSPSYAEIAHEMSLSNVGGVHRLVNLLVERGWLGRKPHAARSLVVLRSVPMPEEPAYVVLAR